MREALNKIQGARQKSNDVRIYEKLWECGYVFDSQLCDLCGKMTHVHMRKQNNSPAI